ncbi:MAG TPA: hypothetical protein VJR05_14315, partial [Acidimicrobiia bacterium]|nr:hypothetical protein [Acidimicrobiia bacterium]
MFRGVLEGFDGDWEGVTSGLVDELVSIEAEIRGRRARQAEIIDQLRELGIDEGEGDRGIEDWVSKKLDVSVQTAHRLAVVSRHPWLWEEMTSGGWGLDRASHLAKLVQAGASAEVVEEAASGFSLGRLWGLVEEHRRVGPVAEAASHDSRFLVVEPCRNTQMVKVWGQFYGTDGELVLKALNARADGFPPLAEGEGCSRGQLLADALTSLCADSLTGTAEGSGGRAVTVAEVFIDGHLAAASQGEAGVAVACGLRVGPETLTEILCDGK